MHGSSPREFDHIPSRVLSDHAVKLENTLFNEPMIEAMRASSIDLGYDPYEELDLIPPQPSYEQGPSEGASVDLGGRALALDSIASARSHEHKLSGAKEQANNPGSYFSRQYGNETYAVLEGMKAKQRSLDVARDAAVEILNASYSMREHGFTEDEVVQQRSGLQQELVALNGIGQKASAVRNKIVRRAERTAKRAQ